ncbi:hypothetical protein [Georgenia sp. SUBG003]|uniref:hypothetical protein n=1 Tax=Georgenia sp. SUBG003 TaxID=1497974 RepID=UPI003AB31CE2
MLASTVQFSSYAPTPRPHPPGTAGNGPALAAIQDDAELASIEDDPSDDDDRDPDDRDPDDRDPDDDGAMTRS